MPYSLAERIFRSQEPYAKERQKNARHWAYPRPAQPNYYQPNQKPLAGWGLTNVGYWAKLAQGKGRYTGAELVNLILGRR